MTMVLGVITAACLFYGTYKVLRAAFFKAGSVGKAQTAYMRLKESGNVNVSEMEFIEDWQKQHTPHSFKSGLWIVLGGFVLFMGTCVTSMM